MIISIFSLILSQFMFKYRLVLANECQPPDVPVGGFYNAVQKKYLPGEKVTYSCFRGYMRMGRETRYCQLNGKWTDQVPFCDWPAKLKNPISSSSAHPASNIHHTIDKVANTCFSTKPGTGEVYRVYLVEPAVINVIRMFLPKGLVKLEITTVNNGYKKKCEQVTRLLEESQWVTVVCNDSYISDSIFIHEISPVKNSLDICEVEIYVKSRMWCEMPPDAFVPNGWLAVSREIAALQCSGGFRPGQNVRLICDIGNKWSGGVLQCVEILCDRVIANTSFGDWQFVGRDSKLSIGSIKRLKCEHGYSLVGGAETIKCLPNGTWTTSTARCEEKPTGLDSKYKGIIIAGCVVVGILLLTCFIIIILLIVKKKSKPVLVVLKPGEELRNPVAYNETEYSTIMYDAIPSLPTAPRYPTPPRSRPPVRVEMEYAKPTDEYPPPYNTSPTYTDPHQEAAAKAARGKEDIFQDLKQSSLYGKS